jgi:uncharacterized membrane protein
MITVILWLVILLFIVTSFVVGITEAFWLLALLIGIGFFISGILLMSSERFVKIWYQSPRRDEAYKKLFSEKQKYFLDRYYSGVRCITGGGGLIAIYWITHQQVFIAIGSWLRGLF